MSTQTQDELRSQASVSKEKDKATKLKSRYMKQIYLWIRDYIQEIQNVLPDDNCGFRCIDNFLGLDENIGWRQVTHELLLKLGGNHDFWVQMWNDLGVKLVKDALSIPEVTIRIPDNKWLIQPDMLELAAHRYSCVVVCYGNQSNTCFPYFSQLSNLNNVRISFMTDLPQSRQFVLLHMTPTLPPIVPTWPSRMFSEADSWKTLFKTQLHIGDVMINKYNASKPKKKSKVVVVHDD